MDAYGKGGFVHEYTTMRCAKKNDTGHTKTSV